MASSGSDNSFGVHATTFPTTAAAGLLLTGTAGDDELNGQTGDDIIDGLGGNDLLSGGAGNDDLIGGTGNDYLVETFQVGGPFGNDSYNGGDGFDRLSYFNGVGGVTVNLNLTGAQNTGTAGTDTIIGIEHIEATPFDDNLIGNEAGNWFWTHKGTDTLAGNGGDDLFTVGQGTKIIDGGSGSDTVEILDDAVPALYTQAGITLSLALQGTVQSTEVGDWTLTNIENLGGSDGNDRLTGDGNANVLLGERGSDVLVGGGGNDTLSGDGTTDIGGTWSGPILFALNPDWEGGSDVLTGGSGADTLTGGKGVDFFRDTAAGLNGDRITDLSAGDHIQITNLTAASANVQFSAGVISFNGGSVTIDARTTGRLIVKDMAGGGVDIRLDDVATNDFNGDGRSDMLLRQDSGWLTNWLGQTNGSFSANNAATSLVHPDWHVAATGNFNGDTRSDLLLRHENGWLTQWLGQANGSFADNGATASYWIHPDWNVASTGDFNGDGRDDLLLRHDNGWMTEWLGQANGSFFDNGAAASRWVHPNWEVAGSGDFNGDGRDDLLLRDGNGWVTEWLGQANGSFTDNGAAAGRWIHPDWHVAGTGDFNGDGIDDVLLRHENGWQTEWLGQQDGSFADNGAVASSWIQPDWQIAEVGDFNGDGIDDMLLRHQTNGTTTELLGNENGAFSSNSAVATYAIDTSWHIQPSLLLV